MGPLKRVSFISLLFIVKCLSKTLVSYYKLVKNIKASHSL